MDDPRAAGFRRLLQARFERRRPRPAVVVATRALGWITRRLPARPAVRDVLDRTLGPVIGWTIHRAPWLFDAVGAGDRGYWRQVEHRHATMAPAAPPLRPFDRAVYAWLGVEGAVMPYGRRFHLTVIDDRGYVERLVHRDAAGDRPGGCPWGLGRPEDGFACRTVMTGSRHVFRGLGHATMKVDIGIPEMVAVERLVTAHVAGTPGAAAPAIWAALGPAIAAVFRRSAPREDDFFIAGELRPETRAVIDELIAAITAGARPAIFCQFRLVPVADDRPLDADPTTAAD